MANWKKRLKRGLKKAAPLIAAGLGAAALGRRKQNQTYLAEEGGDRSIRPNLKRLMTTDRAYTGSGYDDPIMTGGVGVKAPRQSVLASPQWGHWGASYMAKGGRVKGAGKAKRGLGRAFTKRKK